MREFDKKFGPDFLAGVPLLPGVYRFLNEAGEVVYVGKAIRLRRRLQQYRNASRLRRHRKMRKILRAGTRIEFEVCGSHREACLLELDLIQRLRPGLNVSAAFSFLYPMIGVAYEPATARLALYLTHKPEVVTGAVSWHGTYRSRAWTREFFWALVELLEFNAHRCAGARAGERTRGVSSASFRQVSAEWVRGLEQMLSGQDAQQFLERWILELVENAGARSRGSWVQDQLKLVRLFFRQECENLKKARQAAGFVSYPVPQAERDRIFLEARLGTKAGDPVRQPGRAAAIRPACSE